MFDLLKSGFNKFKTALVKTRSHFSERIKALFKKPLDPTTFEEFEKILYEADLGTACVEHFRDQIEKLAKKTPQLTPDVILEELKKLSAAILNAPASSLSKPSQGPRVILIVGVNGSGKTTTCAKLAKVFLDDNKKVLLAAGDTFRAAATEQLDKWAKKLKIDLIKGLPKSDPSAIIFDALTAAKSRSIDYVIADTAGRLQAKTELMRELEKIHRVCEKAIPGSPHEIYLVIDASTGQNGLDQAKVFNEFVPLTGIILTKLDGSAKGGVILSIYREMGIPVQYVGMGESLDDLTPFDVEAYVEALFQ